MTGETHGISEQELRALEIRVEELVRACAHLKEENKKLRSSHNQLSVERSNLIKKNEMARNRVEAIISRLKTLEPNP